MSVGLILSDYMSLFNNFRILAGILFDPLVLSMLKEEIIGGFSNYCQ